MADRYDNLFTAATLLRHYIFNSSTFLPMQLSTITMWLIIGVQFQVAKLEYAKFLQKTLDEMAPKGKGRDSRSASDFVSFYQKIKTQGVGIVNNEEILKFSKLFEDDFTLGE